MYTSSYSVYLLCLCAPSSFFFVFCSTTLELFVYLVDVQLVTEKLFINIQYYRSDVVFFFFVCQFLKVGCA